MNLVGRRVKMFRTVKDLSILGKRPQQACNPKDVDLVATITSKENIHLFHEKTGRNYIVFQNNLEVCELEIEETKPGK